MFRIFRVNGNDFVLEISELDVLREKRLIVNTVYRSSKRLDEFCMDSRKYN